VNPVLLVARREIRERVKAKSFRIATLISAGVIIAAISIPASQRGHTPTYDVAVVNPATPTVVDAIRALAPPLKIKLHVVAEPSLDTAQAGLKTNRFDVVVVGDDSILTKRPPEAGDPGKKAQLVNAISGAVRLERFTATAGPGAAKALEALQQPVLVRGVEPKQASSSQRTTSFIGVLLLFVFLQQYGTWVLMGVVEEKASRVVEVLLSAIRPRQLIVGKVLGIGAVALMQGVVVAIAALGTAQATGTHVFEGTSQFAIAWTLGWFVLGYSFYSFAYAAVGSLVSRQADAQNAAFPVGLPVLVGYISATTLLSGGDPSTFVRVLAFLPPTAPMVMPMLIGLGKVSTLGAFTAMGLLALASLAMSRLAGLVYSRAILHSGQRLKLRQVLRRDFSAA
jgi:ABC-2 type transport system permease protein